MDTTDLIVIGGGFWGCAIANRAMEAGKEVVLFDNGNTYSGSRNASGLANVKWFEELKGMPAWWTKRDTADAFHWLGAIGGRMTGEHFNSYLNREVRYRPGLVTLTYPQAALQTCAKRHEKGVLRVEKSVLDSGWLVYTEDGKGYWASNVCIAAGISTDHFLQTCRPQQWPVGVTGLRGRSLILKGQMDWSSPRTWMPRPYVCYTLKQFGDGYMHLGATTEKTLKAGEKQFTELLSVASMLCPQAKVVNVLDGYRPVCPHGPVVERVQPGLIVATGAGKVGLTMARPVANRVLGMLQ